MTLPRLSLVGVAVFVALAFALGVLLIAQGDGVLGYVWFAVGCLRAEIAIDRWRSGSRVL